MIHFYTQLYIGYLFGAASSQCLTDTSKYTIGRLRPHFLDVCKPDWSMISCRDEAGRSLFVTNYECQGNFDLFPDADEVEHRVKEGHLSFVSGHASFCFQTMVFVILYLQARMTFRGRTNATVFVPFLQVNQYHIQQLPTLTFFIPLPVRRPHVRLLHQPEQGQRLQAQSR